MKPSHQSDCAVPCCLRPMGESSASGSGRFEATSHLLLLRPDDSLTILTMALSIGIRVSVSLHSAIQATRLLTLTSVGLSPTEHTNLNWTRSHIAVSWELHYERPSTYYS